MFHHGGIKKSTLLNFILIYIISFLIEVIGVNTGLIFGEYTYGQTLGLKISNTPVIIGLNWVLLVYLTSSIVEKYNISNLLKILIASFLMLVYNIVLEKVAPLLDLWQFSKNVVPVKNYIAWLIIAIFFHTLIKIFRIHTINRVLKALNMLKWQFSRIIKMFMDIFSMVMLNIIGRLFLVVQKQKHFSITSKLRH
ncbi:MAG: hypothetical protein IGBAC_1943 [Ignavibacteriae bacterium]|nr:MAG: hypothetical protein IGBAC_1943 [Ignavibacteriota bacterium]